MSAFLWICGSIVAIAAAANVILKIRDYFRKPGKSQDAAIAETQRMVRETNRRLDEFETRVNDRFEDYDRYFKSDKIKIDAIEEGNKFMQRAMLALLSHNIDGNNTAQMTKARDNLQEYLIDR